MISLSTFIADSALQRGERDWREKRDAKFEGLDLRFRILQPSACLACSAMLTSLTGLTLFRSMLKMAVQQGRRRIETGGVLSGYVEDFDEPRTKLTVIFSILLILVHDGFEVTTANHLLLE